MVASCALGITCGLPVWLLDPARAWSPVSIRLSRPRIWSRNSASHLPGLFLVCLDADLPGSPPATGLASGLLHQASGHSDRYFLCHRRGGEIHSFASKMPQQSGRRLNSVPIMSR